MESWNVVTNPRKAKAEKLKASYAVTLKPEDKAQTAKTYELTARKIAMALWEERIKDEVEGMKSAEGTVCVMFYLGASNELLHCDDASGFPSEMKGKLKALREVSGVPAEKQTVCAEEHVLAHNDPNLFILSVAFDRRGRKRACAGCSTLLAHYGIKDMMA